MKTNNPTLIKEIRAIKSYHHIITDRRRKKYNGIPVDIYNDIIRLKRTREIQKIDHENNLLEAKEVCQLLSDNLKRIETNYLKIMIEGNTGIYLAHPVYNHSDYNKCRLFNKNEKTIKLMNLYNSIIFKKLTK